MTAIAPVPISRISSLLASQRLDAQIQSDQIGLQQLETQISTGQQLVLPSDDPAAAAQATSLQRLIQQNTQIQTNLSTNQSYLSQTDTALGDVSNLLNSASSTALSALNATSSPAQLQADAQTIQSAIQQLVDIGNQSFNGRYLFAGSNVGSAPFAMQGNNVVYSGNNQALNSFSDINQLFQTNVTGAQAFGAISTGVSGTANLTPVVTADTPLTDLNGGRGVALGNVRVSDGVNSTTVNLSGCVTVGDVAQKLEANPPDGRTLRVDVTPTGLSVSLDAAGGGNLAITDVGGDTTADDLGLVSSNHSGPGPVVGSALNPQLTLTTPLANILGTRASVSVQSPGTNKDFVVQANQNGAADNGYSVNLIDDNTVAVGHETVSVDNTAKTITVDIASGLSTASDVVNALNNSAAFSANFTASIDPGVFGNDGSGALDTSATGTTAGGSGVQLDQSSGMQISNGGQTYNVDVSGDRTVQDLLNTLNGSGASLLAEINPAGNGVDIHSRLSGSDFSIGENGGSTATELGVRTFNASTQLSQLNYGGGVQTASSGADFIIQRPDGVQLPITLGSAKTVQDVVNLINNAPNNQDPAHEVTAALNSTGNGITLTSNDPSTVSPLAVIQQNSSPAAQELGLIPAGQTQSNPATTAAGAQTLVGTDVNPQETNSAFNALLRLQTALQNDDPTGIQRSVGLINDATNQLNLSRADLGAREQSVNSITNSLATQQDNLQSTLSNTTDVDMASAITNLTQLQTSFTATLELTAQLSKLSLVNFL